MDAHSHNSNKNSSGSRSRQDEIRCLVTPLNAIIQSPFGIKPYPFKQEDIVLLEQKLETLFVDCKRADRKRLACFDEENIKSKQPRKN
jgi:hypothetical protein